MHVELTHVCAEGHAWQLLPQLLLSLVVSTHAAFAPPPGGHRVNEPHDATHVPAAAPVPHDAVPPVGSVGHNAHVPLHSKSPAGHD
ncbi:MAG: hypothetical protein ABSC94_26320 [Polyangiaceae bacterium]